MCFANSTILCWFRTFDPLQCASPILRFYAGSVLPIPCNVLRQFYDSMLVPYFRSCNVLRQFYDSALVPYFRSCICALPILQFYVGRALEIVHPVLALCQFYDSALAYDSSVRFTNSPILRRLAHRSFFKALRSLIILTSF